MSQSLILHRDNGGSSTSDPTLSASATVAICIVGAVFFCVILASVIRLCKSIPSQPATAATTVAPEYTFRPYAQAQVEHMRKVRWLNHCNIWDEGREAKREFGNRFSFDDSERPRLNRRTGIGWGFVTNKYHDYVNNAGGYQERRREEDVETDQSRYSHHHDFTHSHQQRPHKQQRQQQQARPAHVESDDGHSLDSYHYLASEILPRSPQLARAADGFRQHRYDHHHRRQSSSSLYGGGGGQTYRQSQPRMWGADDGGDAIMMEEIQTRSINKSPGRRAVRKSNPRIVVSEYGQIFDYAKECGGREEDGEGQGHDDETYPAPRRGYDHDQRRSSRTPGRGVDYFE